MKLRYLFALLAIATILGVYSCQKDDDEPPANNVISRLYISYDDFNQNTGTGQTKYNNVVLLPFADDSVNFSQGAQSFLSDAKGGGTIYFNPSAQQVFQSSSLALQADTFIYKMTVGLTGGLSIGTKIPQGILNGVRGLVYHPSLDKLYSINKRPDSAMVYVFDRPKGLSTYQKKPGQMYNFRSNFEYSAVTIVKNALVVSKGGNEGGVEIFDNLIISRDSTIQTTDPSKILTVSNSSNIQGMSIDTVNNMMALTDYVQTGSGTSATYEGKILIFDDYASISKATGTIVPTRVITGVSTKLKQPVDVALDFRKDSKYLYVADPNSKAVYRFLKTDNGDVAPNQTYQYKQTGRGVESTPVSISLDARK